MTDKTNPPVVDIESIAEGESDAVLRNPARTVLFDFDASQPVTAEELGRMAKRLEGCTAITTKAGLVIPRILPQSGVFVTREEGAEAGAHLQVNQHGRSASWTLTADQARHIAALLLAAINPVGA